MTELSQQVVTLLKTQNKTVATAESCTGGLIAKQITDVSGASAVFHGGVVSYVNSVKRDVLGVSAETLAQEGAVSQSVAVQMACGAKALLHTDCALSTTGVAGPDRDDFDNCVGTVFLALATAEGTFCLRLACGEEKSRAAIRSEAAEAALNLLRRYLSGEDLHALKA